MMGQQEELFNALARRADGHDQDAVINASGSLLLNTLRQQHFKLGDAVEHLDDLVERMKQQLRDRHYSADGQRPVQHIIVPSPRELGLVQ